MNILLTNDDGILAPGLLALHERLIQDHQVQVVAPEMEQSAVGHAITLVDPIRIKPISRNGRFFGYAVSGTPADCVKLAVTELLAVKPDLILSGINLGANVGLNLLYSGTVSAATEAAILGLPALAVSLNTFFNPDFTPAAEFAARAAVLWPELGLPPGVSLNVNIPALPREKIKGAVWTRQCLTPFPETFTRRIDPRGNVYYWRGEDKKPEHVNGLSDYTHLAQGYITITPIKPDLTDHLELSRLKNHNITL